MLLSSTFQLTRSRGAWRALSNAFCYSFRFQLTRSRGAWHFNSFWTLYTIPFQLTRSRGAWRLYNALSYIRTHFNSHAHVERDEKGTCKGTEKWFQLTRSRGAWPRHLRLRLLCRKFQLTRSRGAWPRKACRSGFVRVFQLTRSRGAWPLLGAESETKNHFNSHAHVERDVNLQGSCRVSLTISTHTLTWSVTALTRFKANRASISTHTLTWSVTTCAEMPWQHEHFNSHAHVERDRALSVLSMQGWISTHTLTWSVT